MQFIFEKVLFPDPAVEFSIGFMLEYDNRFFGQY